VRILRQLGSFIVGFALVSLAGILLRASPVMAQQAAPQTWSDLTIARPAPPALPPARLRTAIADDAAGSGVRAPLRQTQRGGDGVLDREPLIQDEFAADGRLGGAEQLVSDDGRDVSMNDPSLPADRAAFLAAPEGYDALAFQIELDPATDARPGRLARFEPYAPIGRRAGSWVVFPTIEAGVGSTTNVYRTSPAKPDFIFDVRPTLLAVTNWELLRFRATWPVGRGAPHQYRGACNAHS
jgi:hypothetical protein